MRAFAPAVYREAQAAIEGLDGYSSVRSANGYACRVSVSPTRKTAPWPRNPATDRLLALWQEAATALGYQVLPEERGGLSDGNFFWQTTPTLDGLGPAGGNAHCSERNEDGSKDQEFCYPGSFAPKTALNATAVLSLLSSATSDG
jgi:glutamate carboxypeptidase